mmetsp:Transcript_13605/g.47407  ORF Transcript_13605/g.47407 Transcript_13605/m.47407 type:complete len:201 (-) Transcript_13605:205-807(-)
MFVRPNAARERCGASSSRPAASSCRTRDAAAAASPLGQNPATSDSTVRSGCRAMMIGLFVKPRGHWPSKAQPRQSSRAVGQTASQQASTRAELSPLGEPLPHPARRSAATSCTCQAARRLPPQSGSDSPRGSFGVYRSAWIQPTTPSSPSVASWSTSRPSARSSRVMAIVPAPIVPSTTTGISPPPPTHVGSKKLDASHA